MAKSNAQNGTKGIPIKTGLQDWENKRNYRYERDGTSTPGAKLRREPGMYNLFAELECVESCADYCTDEDYSTETIVRVQNFGCGDTPENFEVRKATSRSRLKFNKQNT